MIGVGQRAQGFQRPQEQVLQVTSLPAPNRGIDTRAAIAGVSEQNCIYAFNAIPDEYGMTIRGGYREWCINLDDGNPIGGVQTIIVYDGTVTVPSDNRLFVCTNEGIWDCTAYNAPVLVFTFADQQLGAGNGVYCHYTDDAKEEFLMYADTFNGLLEYTASTDTWQPAAGITGVDATKVAFVMMHKQRMWLIEQDSDVGWYLPVASKQGVAEPFYFGPKFKHGGKLHALINWSVDGGLGLDDYLIALSSAGDCIPYQGSDPETVDTALAWESRGTYYIGKIPAGRRCYSEFSGELYLLSSFGVISMSDLLVGVDSRDTSEKSLTFPIASLLRQRLILTSEELGWEPVFLPSQGMLVINSPINPETGNYLQYSMSIALEGWGILRDIPTQVFAEWDNDVYFGTPDNRVCIMDINRDNVLIDQEDPLSDGVAIKFSLLTGYSDAGSPGRFKRAQMTRADFLSELPMNFRSKVLYDYKFAEQFYPIDAEPAADAVGSWDIGRWDQVVWGSGELINRNELEGTSGMGRVMAVAIQGDTVSKTRFVSYDVMWIDGGPI